MTPALLTPFKTLTDLRASQQGTAEELTRVQAAVGTPFKHAQAVEVARDERARITQQISANAERPSAQAGAASNAPVEPADLGARARLLAHHPRPPATSPTQALTPRAGHQLRGGALWLPPSESPLSAPTAGLIA
jgi:hypothetical protein